MKNSRLIKLIITFYIYFIQFEKIKAEKTSWKDPISGFKYDWSKLKRNKNNPYIIKDKEIDDENFSIKYYFNIGKPLNQKCKNKTSSVFEMLEYEGKNTNICEILGRDESFNIYTIDKENPHLGIVLEYGDGDICKTSQNEELFQGKQDLKFIAQKKKMIILFWIFRKESKEIQNVLWNLKYILLLDAQLPFYQKLSQVKF